MLRDSLPQALAAAIHAGSAIGDIYRQDFAFTEKADHTPLTEADLASQQIISKMLGDALPMISEETSVADWQTRSAWETCWIVDPLDGTKEFIRRNGEFTVNIGLIHQQYPVLGVVFAPALGQLYWAAQGMGAFYTEIDWSQPLPAVGALLERGAPLGSQALPASFTVVASRSHSSPETEAYIQGLEAVHGSAVRISSGSSLKFCLVANGRAHYYPRLAPTMEWDTAAADAVAREAGCDVTNFNTGLPLLYNKPDLQNPWFVVSRAF